MNNFSIYQIQKKLWFPVLFFVGLILSCENDVEKIKLITNDKKLPVETVKDAEILYSDSAKVKLKLTAPQLDRYLGEEPYLEFPRGLKVTFYNSRKEPESELTAKYGIFFEAENRMETKNDVVVVNKLGEKLNTEHLIWQGAEEKIYTDEFVKITTKDEIIYGDGMVANQDFTKYTIKNIKGTIQINENEEEE